MLFLTLGLPLLYTKTTMADSMRQVSKHLEWTFTLIKGQRLKSSGMLFMTIGLPLLYTKTTMAYSMNKVSKDLEWTLTLIQGH